MTCRGGCGLLWLTPCALWATGPRLLPLVLVLEGEPELGAEGDLAILADVQVLLDYLGDAQIPQGLTCGVHGVGGGVLPRLSTRSDEVGYPVHAHCILLRREEPQAHRIHAALLLLLSQSVRQIICLILR